jgi:hypothetical protein
MTDDRPGCEDCYDDGRPVLQRPETRARRIAEMVAALMAGRREP